eukprot:EG_transcript_24001
MGRQGSAPGCLKSEVQSHPTCLTKYCLHSQHRQAGVAIVCCPKVEWKATHHHHVAPVPLPGLGFEWQMEKGSKIEKCCSHRTGLRFAQSPVAELAVAPQCGARPIG